MIVDSYEKTEKYEKENTLMAKKLLSEDLQLFKFLYDQNLSIIKWMSVNKKVDSARAAFVLNRLHKALRFLFTGHNLALSGQCDEANILIRNIIELLLSSIDIRPHNRAWGEVQVGKYSFKRCFERITKDQNLCRYHWLIIEHGKLSGFWSHENLKTDRIESHPTTYETGEFAISQELQVGYSHANPRLWFCFADFIKLCREITQTIDFLFNQVLQKERSIEWLETKKRFEQFLIKEKTFKIQPNLKDK